MQQNQALPPTVIETLIESRYGYSFSDIGLTAFDLADLDLLQIVKNKDYNQFGNESDWENEIEQFLTEIGPNPLWIANRVAHRVAEIAHTILSTSGKETAWICLRAGLPNTKYDQPRWHMDAHYYDVKANSIQYKYALALIGSSTLFYPIPKEHIETRKIIWRHMANRQFMSELCDPGKVVSPQRGQGIYFIAGDCRIAAIHSEPPIHENRLFFSIIPCHEEEIASLKEKVMQFYKKNKSVYNP